MSRLLSADEVATQLAGLPGWSRRDESLVATFEAPDFPAAIRLVEAAADEPQA